MMPEQEHRVAFLSHGPCVPIEYVADYYGLAWPFVGELGHDYEIWKGQFQRRPSCPEGQVSRYLIESFMQRRQVVPKKWMGARLGMSMESLDTLLAGLEGIGLRPQRYIVYPEMIADSLSEDLATSLRGLRFRTFSDHNSFCERLHVELQKQLDMRVEPLFCATSTEIEDYPRQYANSFDCITLQPLSGRHQMWLDFRKPMNLGPDRCSKLFYLENHDALRSFLAGTREPDLTVYQQFIGGRGHAG